MSLNNGDATYQTTTYWTGAYAGSGIEFADLDGQPGPEVIVLNVGSSGGGPPGIVTVFTNDGTGNFFDRCNYEVGGLYSWGLAVGDLDGDSWNDAVAATLYGGSSLLLNQGAGCVGDVDGDGDTDLADLSRLLTAYATSVGDPAYDPAADFDGDGDVDLADLSFLLTDYGCTP